MCFPVNPQFFSFFFSFSAGEWCPYLGNKQNVFCLFSFSLLFSFLLFPLFLFFFSLFFDLFFPMGILVFLFMRVVLGVKERITKEKIKIERRNSSRVWDLLAPLLSHRHTRSHTHPQQNHLQAKKFFFWTMGYFVGKRKKKKLKQ